MSYRIHEHPRPLGPQRSIVDISTPIKVIVHNGTTANIAFPCWYQEIHRPIPAHPHDYHWHDYVGWPSPSHPDHCCQLWSPDRHCCSLGKHHECSPHCHHYIDYRNVFPIHLTEEGYTGAAIKWNTENRNAPTGIVATAEIDPDEDWVVRVNLDLDVADAIEEPQKFKFTVFANAPQIATTNPKTGQSGRTLPARSDIVALAELIVLPSSYQG